MKSVRISEGTLTLIIPTPSSVRSLTCACMFFNLHKCRYACHCREQGNKTCLRRKRRLLTIIYAPSVF